MEYLKKILSSRTIWTLLFLIVFNAFYAVSGMVNPLISVIVNSILTTTAGYFRINTKTQF